MVENYTVRQLAESLQLHPNTVYGWVSEGRFPNAFRICKGWRIPASDVENLKHQHPWRPVR